MNKSNLYLLLAKECNLSMSSAVSVVDVFFDSIADSLVRGNRVEIRGFCSWQPKEYSGYSGRNPHTGESIEIPDKRLAVFKPGKDLVDLLNAMTEKDRREKKGKPSRNRR